MQYINNAKLSPKEALLSLVQGLRRGGETYTGSEADAGDAALDAIASFCAYFNDLPIDMQETLKTLHDESSNFQLADFFLKINDYFCVEQLSDLIKRIINYNEQSDILNVAQGFSVAYLKEIENKCRKGINFQKETLLQDYFPGVLARRVVEQVKFESPADFVLQLIKMPNEFMVIFWKYILVDNLEGVFEQLSLQYQDHLISEEKWLAIINGIAENSDRFPAALISLIELTSQTEETVFSIM